MKCFYHSGDFDGICSGAIIKYKYPDCEMFGIDYGDEFPWDVIVPGETVFMCSILFKLKSIKVSLVGFLVGWP